MKTIDLEYQQAAFIKELGNKGKSFNTLKNYKTDLNIFKGYLTSKSRSLIITEITNSEIQEYGQYLNKKYNSPNSIRRRVQALRIFCDFLISQSLLDDNPVKKMLVQPKVVDLPKPTPFHIVKNLKSKLVDLAKIRSGHEKLLAQRNIILFNLIYSAGLKVSDIEKLDHCHITQTNSQYRVIVAPEKRDPYTVTLPEEFNESFETYFKLLEKAKNKDKIEFGNLLFNGNPFKILSGGLSARGIEVIFKEISNSIDHQITAKYLRQACIFKWLCLKVPDSRIKEWMGVQPQYSLKPYKELIHGEPASFSYLEV